MPNPDLSKWFLDKLIPTIMARLFILFFFQISTTILSNRSKGDAWSFIMLFRCYMFQLTHTIENFKEQDIKTGRNYLVPRNM